MSGLCYITLHYVTICFKTSTMILNDPQQTCLIHPHALPLVGVLILLLLLHMAPHGQPIDGVNTNRFATTVKPTSVMLTLELHSQQKVSN